MKPFQFRREFSPGRKDARVEEAKAFALGARHLRNCDELGLASQFNLKYQTAAKVLVWAKLKRGDLTIADLTPEQRRDQIDPGNVDIHAIAAGPIMDGDKIYLPAGRVSLEEAEAREGLRIEGGDDD